MAIECEAIKESNDNGITGIWTDIFAPNTRIVRWMASRITTVEPDIVPTLYCCSN